MANMKIVRAIIDYLNREAEKSNVTSDTKESLEVAVQCLHTAYDIDPSKNPVDVLPISLEELFEAASLSFEGDDSSQSDKLKKSEMMKNIGNKLMKENYFHDAIRYYTSAIDLNSENAIYYGNRAAAYSKLNDFQNAIKDCKKAIEIDPMYAKAYGRMGLAYASLEQHDEAIQAFKKAVELDPSNDSYQSNLKIAQEKKEKPTSSTEGGLPGFSNVPWQTIFTNPAFRNLASTMMQDPNIINAFSVNMASPSGQSSQEANDMGSGSVPSPESSSNINMLLEAGQYLATQMQAANPDLVEQFRQAASRSFNHPNQDNRDSSAQ